MARTRQAQAGSGSTGFTIIELTVVMGLLSVFMVFLLQILLISTDVFHEGQRGQEASARGLAAGRPGEAALRRMTGPTHESRQAASDARLLVQWAPIGLDWEDRDGLGEIKVLRSTVRAERHEEERLLSATFRDAAEAIVGGDPDQLLGVIQQMIRRRGLKGRAVMLFLPWPEGDKEGAYFELRRGLFLPDEALGFREAEGARLMDVERLGGPRFPAKYVPGQTEVVATGLLHISYRLASQYTEDWRDGPEAAGPETVWDSARRGWLLDSEVENHRFSLDLGEISAKDSTDDVYPRYIELTVVAGGSSQDLPESQLAADVGAGDKTIVLVNVDRLPPNIHENYLKIGSEWVRFSELRGRTLRGVRRGQRGTRARNHGSRTGVRAGRTEVMMVRILHGRDSWNG